MIILGLLKVMFWLTDALTAVIIPALPDNVLSVYETALDYITQGCKFIYLALFDANVVIPILNWLLAFWVVSITVDLVWKVIGLIKLHRS